jgi:hypothetical protein
VRLAEVNVRVHATALGSAVLISTTAAANRPAALAIVSPAFREARRWSCLRWVQGVAEAGSEQRGSVSRKFHNSELAF